ncbi:MAG: lytic transglycosylase domain-containing protein [Chitinophagaceae bacterium]|nr:lytic transglycosylase domain-containing protein [Chitinophagaceae bacterium]
MKINKSLLIYVCALLLPLLNASVLFGQKFDTIVIIKTKAKKDTSILTTKKVNAIDSSRFVKRKNKSTNSNQSYTGVKSPFKVSYAVFGIYADYINDYVKNYQLNHGNRLSRIQTCNRAHFKLIDNIMKRYSVPKEMKALAIIESAMNCNAVSPVGAVGTWQFMEGTAKMMGLRVDQSIDERRDMYKSTNAAARYLKQLHGMFHDWLLVIASYNCGPAPVLRAINSGMGRSFWDIKPKLPKETQNHVMAFIATNAFLDRFTNVLNMGAFPKGAKAPKPDFSNLKSINKSSIEEETEVEDIVEVKKPEFSKEELEQMAILKVKGNYKLETISRILDEDIVRLRKWNPTFEKDIVKATTTIHLRLPINKLEKFIISKEQILAESKK